MTDKKSLDEHIYLLEKELKGVKQPTAVQQDDLYHRIKSWSLDHPFIAPGIFGLSYYALNLPFFYWKTAGILVMENMPFVGKFYDSLQAKFDPLTNAFFNHCHLLLETAAVVLVTEGAIQVKNYLHTIEKRDLDSKVEDAADSSSISSLSSATKEASPLAEEDVHNKDIGEKLTSRFFGFLYERQKADGFSFLKKHPLNPINHLVWEQIIYQHSIDDILDIYSSAASSHKKSIFDPEINIFVETAKQKRLNPSDPFPYLIDACFRLYAGKIEHLLDEWEAIVDRCELDVPILVSYLKTSAFISDNHPSVSKHFSRLSSEVAKKIFDMFRFEPGSSPILVTESKNEVYSLHQGVLMKKYSSQSALDREAKMNKLLSMHGILTPETFSTFFDPKTEEAYLLMRYFDASTLSDIASSSMSKAVSYLPDIARTLAKIHAVVPSSLAELHERDYMSYLKKSLSDSEFDIDVSLQEEIAGSYDVILQSMHSSHLVFCKDAHPGNWMISAKDRIISIDNEVTRLAPMQVDLVNLLEYSFDLGNDAKKGIIDAYIHEFESLSGESIDMQDFMFVYEQVMIQRSLELSRYYSTPVTSKVGQRLISKSIAILEDRKNPGNAYHDRYKKDMVSYDSLLHSLHQLKEKITK